ncbi:probable ATP-dependent RNA helicase DDX20 [Nymphalis io]|uniref:probable ATP-dependent RNA helicase DDX20 n=1 Tax=Inachis io TaxID=171585 RepID=UPI002168CFF9|nr:probable ATP-dependent RNA helicase DDX20 [Nymphalis io]XP_050351534.1 probable ATP-dependent RNA helicase DDX20 [Nymphalis io]
MVLAHNISNSKRTTDVQIYQDVTFDTMLLCNNTLNGLKEAGFFKPSPIQLHGIPLGKCGFDLMLEAKSGTGKTAVFTIIALEKLDLNKGIQVIILAPTREIASQICDVLKQIGCKYDGLCVEVVMGGLPIQDDINKFKEKNAHIVVGSPGRLKHLIQDKHINTNSVRLLILDEADKLMEKSFLADIKFIHSFLPNQKQVILSSATYPENSKELINQFVYDAQHICPNSNCVLLGVSQKITYVKYNNNIVKQTEFRFKELLKILTKIQFKQCLIFCNYQTRVGDLHKMLTREKWPAEQLYGKQEQTERLDAIKTLQEYKCRLLISTDLAARGIDASNVDLVINFEPPFEWQTYLHRIGRAGRYGSYGMAVTILSEGVEEKKFFNLLEAFKISDNLTPLWNGDNTNKDVDIPPTIEPLMSENTSMSKITEDNIYMDFWEILCENKEKLEVNKSVESFGELFNSFEKLEVDNIKSFFDLLMSFNNNNLPDPNENCICQYKCIDTPNIPVKDYLKRLNIVKESILNSSKKKSTELSIEDQKKLDDSHDKNLTITEIDIENDKHTSGTPMTAYNNDNKNFLLNNSRYIENKNKGLNNEANKCSDILDLGLPDAFSSSKNKPRFLKDSKATVMKGTEDKKKYSSNEYLRNRKEYVLKSSDSEFNVTKMSKQKFMCNRRKSSNRSNYNCKSEDSSSDLSSEDYHECSQKNTETNSYTNWYNQLKFNVKQIEIVTYIDELSKL